MDLKRIIIISSIGITLVVTVAFIAGFKAIFYFTVPVVESSPEQPIAFSHKQHAGEFGIHCLYCHRYAEVSVTAGVPDMELCVSCHDFIAPDKTEVVKLVAYAERSEPIPWVKVHDLPDFVYFPHKTHLDAGIECKSCHGDVAAMDRVERVERLAMRWCLDCHREKEVTIDCLQCHM